MLSRNSVEKLTLENTKERLSVANTSNNNTKNYSILNVTEKKMLTNNNQNNINNVSNLGVKNANVDISSPKQNNFLFNSSGNYSKNQNVIKNLKTGSTGSRPISNSSHTPNKHIVTNPNNPGHRPTKSNFLSPNVDENNCDGYGNSNTNNLVNSNVFNRHVDTAKKIQSNNTDTTNHNQNDKNIYENKQVTTTLTPNTGNKNVFKIKNFYEIVKNGTVHSNSNSARVNSNPKVDGLLNSGNKKSSFKK